MLGAGYIVDEAAPPCAVRCGRAECRVSAESPPIIGRHTQPTRALRLGEATPISSRRPFDPPAAEEKREPKTAEQLRAEEQARADAQPITTYCGLCDWRFEGTVGEGREAARLHREAEHPGAVNGKRRSDMRGWRRTAAHEREREAAMAQVEQRRRVHGVEEGRDLLDRMDAGEPLNEEAGLEEASEPNGAGADASSSPEAGPAEPAQTPAGDGAVTGLDTSNEKRRRGELQLQVLRAIAAGNTSGRAIASALGKADSRGISGALVALVKKGLAEKISYGVYEVSDAGREAVAEGANLDAGRKRSEREPQADGTRRARRPSLDAAGTASSRSEKDKQRVKVAGTGLTYRNVDEAIAAADEIEADGVRVADQARADGNEEKALQAIDAAHELAEKIRAAAGVEGRSGSVAEGGGQAGGSRSASGSSRPQGDARVGDASPSLESPRLLVTPDEMTGFQRGIARALIAGMRAAADALEQELAA